MTPNLCMAIVIIAVLCYGACVRLSPRAMRWWGDWLNAKADADDFNGVRFKSYRGERAQREEQP